MRNVHEKEAKERMRLDEYVRTTGLISNRVAMLEEDFSTLSSTCNSAAKSPPVDPSEEKFQALEAEIVEAKKVGVLNLLVVVVVADRGGPLL